MAGHQYAVTAIGVDRPGIVAAVAGALVGVGGNVEDSAMTILGGHFAIVLLVATNVDAEALEAALHGATTELGLTIAVSEVGVGRTSPMPTHVLSVYGADHPGILAGVTRTLAEVGANVTDLETRLLSPGADPIYAMIIELVAGDDAALVAALESVCEELGVDHTLRTLEAETF